MWFQTEQTYLLFRQIFRCSSEEAIAIFPDMLIN